MTINKSKFFSIVYTTKDGRTETYICRAGVTKWKNQNCEQCEVKGTGRELKEGLINLYCTNRRNYRSFKLDMISKVKQGSFVSTSLN